MRAISKSEDDAGEEGMDVFPRQLSIIFGVDNASFEGSDIRKLAAAVKFVGETVQKQIEIEVGNLEAEAAK